MKNLVLFAAPPVQVFEKEALDDIWIEAMIAKTYDTQQYGEVVMSPDRFERMVKNFDDNIRGQDIAINFNHGWDKAKGDKAAGWYKGFAIRPSSSDSSKLSLYAKVELTEEAKAEVKDKQWKYFSLEWWDETEIDKKKYEDVIVGGALTNKPVAKGMAALPINFAEFAVINETKELEHSEPGTGNPPIPREDGDGSDDADRKGGWRRVSPPDQTTTGTPSSRAKLNKEGSIVPEEFAFAEKDVRDLLRELDLDLDTKPEDVVIELKKKFAELAEMRKAANAVDQEKEFAEKYPQYWDEHNKLMLRDRNNSAKNFAESVTEIKKAEGYGLKGTKQKLSPVAVEKITETHRKFAEGSATAEDFESTIKAIVNGGIIAFGEIGTSENGNKEIPDFDANSPAGIAAARKYFAECVTDIQKENPEWDYVKCVTEATKKNPDLAEAYRTPVAG